jgi:hypothetical protein
MLQNIQTGLDTISLLGSYITSNDKFIFISSNGYNIYNGMIMVFFKNVENIDNNLTLEFHSEIHTPEDFNSNFGVKTSATNTMLVVSAISYNIYDGVIYIYELFKDIWIYKHKIYVNTNNKINGFGSNVQINNNELFISTFYNQLYHYKYDDANNQFTLNKTFNIFNLTDVNLDVKMISDFRNNLFISNLTNTLTIINIDKMAYIYLLQEDSFNCFYGSELFIYKTTLFVSCSLYYPFYNIPEEINNQIYIYDLIYASNIIKNIVFREIIYDIHYDPYFGTHLSVNDKYLLISGRNAIYYYSFNNNKNKKTQFKNEYIIPYSEVNYDYKVLLIDNYFIVGNYGFNDLQGAVFIGNILDNDIPSYINNIPDDLNKSSLLNNIFSVILLIIIGSFLTVVTTLFCYFFVTLFTPKNDDDKKKKKEDEEFSPYKVYSYIGYVETDDAPPIVYPMNYNPQYYYSSYYSPQYYNPQYYYNPHIEKEKEKEENVLSPEKVVSYRGYIYDSIQQKYKEKIKPILHEIKKE